MIPFINYQFRNPNGLILIFININDSKILMFYPDIHNRLVILVLERACWDFVSCLSERSACRTRTPPAGVFSLNPRPHPIPGSCFSSPPPSTPPPHHPNHGSSRSRSGDGGGMYEGIKPGTGGWMMKFNNQKRFCFFSRECTSSNPPQIPIPLQKM